MVVSYVLLVTPRISQYGLVGGVPTTALIWWVGQTEVGAPPDPMNTAGSAAVTELARRAGNGELHGWQWRWLLNEVGFGRSRDRWPTGQPVVVAVGLPGWLREAVGSPALSSRLSDGGRGYGPFTTLWTVGTPPAGGSSVSFDVDLEHWAGSWTVPYRGTSTVEAAIERVSDPGIDAIVKRALRLRLNRYVYPAIGSDMVLDADLFRSQATELDDIAIGLQIELVHDGEVTQSFSIAMIDSAVGDPTPIGSLYFRGAASWHDLSEEELGRWTVRVRGDAQMSLLDFNRDSYWSGNFEQPIGDLLD
jgi:hypothetical protein